MDVRDVEVVVMRDMNVRVVAVRVVVVFAAIVCDALPVRPSVTAHSLCDILICSHHIRVVWPAIRARNITNQAALTSRVFPDTTTNTLDTLVLTDAVSPAVSRDATLALSPRFAPLGILPQPK